MLQDNAACRNAECTGISRLADEELIEQISTTTTMPNKAYDELVKRHYSWVYRVCLIRLGNQSDAEDVAQDVFVRVQKHIRRFENRSAVRTWLYRIAQNQCNTFVSKNNRIVIESIEDYAENLKDVKTEISNTRRELTDETHYVISKLSEQCRAIIDLRFFQDLSLEEISEQLNIGLSAAKMRLYRSIKQFKNLYMEEIYS